MGSPPPRCQGAVSSRGTAGYRDSGSGPPERRGDSVNGQSHPRGHRWEAFARLVIAHYGGLCHICGHGGAGQADHVITVADRPDLAWKLENCRPAHGAPGNPCPVCTRDCGRPVYCNQLRGAMTIGRARRIIAEWAAEHAGARPPGRPEPDTAAGRTW